MKNKRLAFTLAEVLITLGVIGVVAAMTMPTLMSNYRKHVAETRLAKFYSVMNQAVEQSEVANGPKEHWDSWGGDSFEEDSDGNPDYSKPKSVPFFNKYLEPYLKTNKIEYPTEGATKIIVYFSDGSCARMSGTGIDFFIDGKYCKLSSSQEMKSLSGTKYFAFYFAPSNSGIQCKYHYKRGIEPYKYLPDPAYANKPMSEFLKTDKYVGCKVDMPKNGRAYCAALIQMNGWKIPKDYPLKF